MQLRLPRWKISQWLALGAGVIVVLVGGYYVLRTTGALDALRRLPVREWVRQIAALGPVPFLLGLVILPAFGAPVSFFYVIAGAVFEHRGGLGVALVGCFVAIAGNLAFTYALGRWLMHPVIERLVRRFGWKVPQVRHEDRFMVTLLLRIAVGPPFFAQSYLLALGRVPFGSYMLVSCPVAWALGGGMIVFGDSLATGSAGKLIFGIMLVVAVGIVVHMMRKRLQERRPAAVAEAAGEPIEPAPLPGNEHPS